MTTASVPVVVQPTDCTLVNDYSWDTKTAFAVCEAESRGNSQAHLYSDITRDDSYGLFQINLYGDLKYGRPAPTELLNASQNVAYAYKLYVAHGDSFSPWSTYKTGAYLNYL